MHGQKTCGLCIFAWLVLFLVAAGLFAMPFLPSIEQEFDETPYYPTIKVETTLIDPATVGSADRAEMTYPDD